jgi:hypothetical protein
MPCGFLIERETIRISLTSGRDKKEESNRAMIKSFEPSIWPSRAKRKCCILIAISFKSLLQYLVRVQLV